MAHPPGECAGVECTVDAGTQFCEQCGRDRDSFASARSTYRDCPSCGAACCADCWNLLDNACLACAPFRLPSTATRPRIVIAADLAPTTARVDPYADLRSDPGTGSSASGTGFRAGAPISSAGAPGSSTAAPRRQRRRAGRVGRVGLAASAAWVVVGALAVVVVGASPAWQVAVPLEASPAASFSPAPPWPVVSPVVSPAPSVRPTHTPRATATPRSGGGTGGAGGGTGGGGTRGTPRATPSPTPRPAGPVVVAPPPAPKPPTPATTPMTTPGPDPTATAKSIPAAATAQP